MNEITADNACSIISYLDGPSIYRWSRSSPKLYKLLEDACKKILPPLDKEFWTLNYIIRNTVGSENELINRINYYLKNYKFGECLVINCFFTDKRNPKNYKLAEQAAVYLKLDIGALPIPYKDSISRTKKIDLFFRNDFIPSCCFEETDESIDGYRRNIKTDTNNVKFSSIFVINYFKGYKICDINKCIPFLNLTDIDFDKLNDAVKNVKQSIKFDKLSYSERELVTQKLKGTENESLMLKQIYYMNIKNNIPEKRPSGLFDIKSKIEEQSKKERAQEIQEKLSRIHEETEEKETDLCNLF